jgi:polar amino acid transport system substrate-binding protein
MRARKVMHLSTLLAALLLVHAAALAETVIMRADPWYPVNLDPSSDKPGYVIEIARLALQRAGHTLDYALYPWERSVDGVRRGQIDCLPGVHRNTVPDFIFMTENVGVDRMAFYTRSDAPSFEYRGLADLQDKVLAVIGGYGYSDEIDAYIKSAGFGPALQVTRGDRPLERNIRMLLAGRVDLVLESIAALEHTAAEMNVLPQLKRAAQLPDLVPIYIACSPAKSTSHDYVKLLDEGVRELRASGELQRILEKYGMQEWQQRSASE